MRLSKNIALETTHTIQNYNEMLDGLMQNFWDQVSPDVAIYVYDMAICDHHTGKDLDVLVT